MLLLLLIVMVLVVILVVMIVSLLLGFVSLGMLLTLPAEATWSSSVGALFEHELRVRIDRPVVAFSGPADILRQLDEALVQ